MQQYLHTDDVAELVGHSERWVRERIAGDSIPYRRLPGIRRVLFDRSDLDAWLAGAQLQAQALPGGGRVVRPVTS